MIVWPALVLIAAALVVPVNAAAGTIRYVLTTESHLEYACDSCDMPATSREPLHGSFDLTVMRIPAAYAIEALTAVDWQSDSFTISGAGFLQRFGTDRLAVVIDARINGVITLLTTGEDQQPMPAEIRLDLASSPDDDDSFAITIVAVPAVSEGPDADEDGIPDGFDNCPMTASSDQRDSDHDAIGDACDACPETPPASPVLSDGCSPSQRCPCEGPAPGVGWSSQRAYAQCVARDLKKLRDEGQLSRSEIRRLLQDAVRSGCGRRLLALR